MKPYIAFKKYFTKKHLKNRYTEKIKGTQSIGLDRISPQKFQENLDENIDIIVRKVRNNTYRFTRYKQLLFLKGAKKPPRCVSIPTVRDRLTLSVLNEIITAIYEQKCVTEMPQVIINSIVSNVNDYNYFIKLDVKSFYSAINHNVLLKQLKRKIRKKELLTLIEKAIKTPSLPCPINKVTRYEYNKVGIPEGLAISNALANIYLMDIDEEYSKRKDIKYWRYVDDILLFTNNNNYKCIKDEFINNLKKLGLDINDKADEGEICNGFSYLGYQITPQTISVRESSILKLEQSLEDLCRTSPTKNINYLQWKLNLKITGFVINKNKYGWMFFFSQIDDMRLLFHLDDLVGKYLKRFKLDKKIKPKRFVRTYFDIRKSLHNLRYVPNFDQYSAEDKRDALSRIYGESTKNLSDSKIEFRFNEIIANEIKEIEKDVQGIS